MRALILISTCVIFLAAMQAAYLVVDARHHGDKKEIPVEVSDHHLKGDEGVNVPQYKLTEEPVEKVRKHHKKELSRGEEDEKDKDIIYKPSVVESDKKENKRGYLSYGKKLRWRKCREYPELCNKKKPSHRGRKGQGRRDRKDRKDRKERRKERKNKHKNGLPTTPTPSPDSIQQILELSLDPSSPKQQFEKPIGYEVDPVEATQELYSKVEQNTSTVSYSEQNNIPGDKKMEEQETSIYDQMIGDDPGNREGRKRARQEKREQKKAQRQEKQKSRQEKKEQREQKKEGREEKKASKHAEKERKHAERSQRKMEKQQKKFERQQKKNEKQERRGICERDDDCDQGECCIAKRNGKKSCRRGGVKELGKKCESNCMCQEGLQCFVSDTNKRGKKKRVRPNHRTYGKCTNPTERVDPNSGYFMTTAPTTIDPNSAKFS